MEQNNRLKSNRVTLQDECLSYTFKYYLKIGVNNNMSKLNNSCFFRKQKTFKTKWNRFGKNWAVAKVTVLQQSVKVPFAFSCSS